MEGSQEADSEQKSKVYVCLVMSAQKKNRANKEGQRDCPVAVSGMNIPGRGTISYKFLKRLEIYKKQGVEEGCKSRGTDF